MSGRRRDWDKAKWDSIKNNLVPTGEDICHSEEAELQAAHEAKKGIYPQPEPDTQREDETLDLPTREDRLNLVASINRQVKLREQRRKLKERDFQSFANLRSKPTGPRGRSK